MKKGTGMDLVQLWRNDKNSFARTKDGRLVALNGEEAEHLVVRADQAIPVPLSTGRDTRVSIPRSAHTVVVTDHPLPSHLKATANSHFNTAEFMDIGSLPDNSVVLRIDISPDFNHLLNTETKALAFGAAMKAVFVRYPQLVIGPLSTPEYPNLYRHLEKRIISASLVPETTWASLRTPLFDVIAEKLSLTPDSLNISTSINDEVTDALSCLEWTTIDLLAREEKKHVLVPWITWAGYRTEPRICSLHDPEFCDETAGIITRLRRIQHHPALPPLISTVQSDVTDIRVISPWSNNTVCQGSTVRNPLEARRAAVGEAVERYCVNVLDMDRVVVSSYDALASEGLHPVAPEKFVLFSDEQYANPGCRFERLTRSTVIPWFPAKNISRQDDALVPLSMVYVNYNRAGTLAGRKVDSFPLVNPVPYAGIAAGVDTEGALVNGLEEIIERDATMIWWHSRPTLNRVTIRRDAVEEVADSFTERGFSLSFFLLPSEFKIPVIAAVLENRQYRTCNIGFSCRPTIEDAALKAITEASTLFDGAVDLLNPNGRMYRSIANKELSPRMALPWRGDRKYLDTIEWDYNRVTDLMIQQHINLDPRAAELRAPHLDRPVQPLDEDLVNEGESRTVGFYRDRLERHGFEVFAADVTTKDILACGGNVLRAIVPGLVPNFAAGDITLGKDRILNTYFEIGLHSRPQRVEELNFFPLPHA